MLLARADIALAAMLIAVSADRSSALAFATEGGIVREASPTLAPLACLSAELRPTLSDRRCAFFFQRRERCLACFWIATNASTLSDLPVAAAPSAPIAALDGTTKQTKTARA